jgi:hypothetical protein
MVVVVNKFIEWRTVYFTAVIYMWFLTKLHMSCKSSKHDPRRTGLYPSPKPEALSSGLIHCPAFHEGLFEGGTA